MKVQIDDHKDEINFDQYLRTKVDPGLPLTPLMFIILIFTFDGISEKLFEMLFTVKPNLNQGIP